jgi:hypothetical protein
MSKARLGVGKLSRSAGLPSGGIVYGPMLGRRVGPRKNKKTKKKKTEEECYVVLVRFCGLRGGEAAKVSR